MAIPAPPSRFPCWCRAVYSWGGETDKDLGFIEGDLIECLNAGDGSWWMGRLRRDRRMMGLFPSNFVTVLGDSFVPVSRSVSPMPESARSSASRDSLEALEKKKEKAKSRRPFQGYKTTSPRKQDPEPVTVPTVPMPAPRGSESEKYHQTNPPSTVLWQQRPVSRATSRSPSPLPGLELGSSPPPPPPPHRTRRSGDLHRAASPLPAQPDITNTYHTFSRTPSPGPVSMNGHTPPMIRDAMDGVMSSLDDMASGPRDDGPDNEQAFNPWSPEAFEDLHRTTTMVNNNSKFPRGYGSRTQNLSEQRPTYSSRQNSPERFEDGQTQLETYVERMERQLRARAQARDDASSRSEYDDEAPAPPPKTGPWVGPVSPMSRQPSMRRRKSAFEMGSGLLKRTYTTKTSSTSSSSGIQSNTTQSSQQSSRTSQSVMSGFSAGEFSATSAGSLARHNQKMQMQGHVRPTTSAGLRSNTWEVNNTSRPQTPGTGTPYRSGYGSRAGAQSAIGWGENDRQSISSGLGGLTTPKTKKASLWKKIADSGKTAFASTRSTIVPNGTPTGRHSASSSRSGFNNGLTSVAGGKALSSVSPFQKIRQNVTATGAYGRDAAEEMGLGSVGGTWLTARQAINRSNTPGPSEKQERADRCQMLNEPVICPVEELYEIFQGNEGADGMAIQQSFQMSNPSFTQIDKAARFVTSLPSSITAATLATTYLCRPYRSDVQRLRAIFIWCAERINWNGDAAFERYGESQMQIDTRHCIQTRRASTKELAQLVMEMCHAIGLQAEIVQGHLKLPGDELDLEAAASGKANHWWNAVLCDGEWRMLDASLASPTHPQRAAYSSVSTSIAEAWYFLAKPSELCWTHVPLQQHQQHIIPAASPDTLLALPVTCPPFFRLNLGLHNYDTSLIRLDGLEMCTVSVNVPSDVELVAEVEAKTFLHDQDGDVYEDTDRLTTKRALSQACWYQIDPYDQNSMMKRYIIKAVLPGDERFGVLKVYAGKKGLMHSSREIVHPLALTFPLYHSGSNPPYEFVRRHPTIHATRQDLYVVQPQCFSLAAGETFVFCVRQHSADFSSNASSIGEQTLINGRPVSPNPFHRPSSAMSMTSSTQDSNQGSESSSTTFGPQSGAKVKDKPAKLAIQSPGGKIIRLSRKHDSVVQSPAALEVDGQIGGSLWETIVKITERGVWRGLVLADRSARWCVWGEWECS